MLFRSKNIVKSAEKLGLSVIVDTTVVVFSYESIVLRYDRSIVENAWRKRDIEDTKSDLYSRWIESVIA